MEKNKRNHEKTPQSFASRRFSFWSELFVRAAVAFAVSSVAAVLFISIVNDVLALSKPPVRATVTASDSAELAEKLGEAGIIDHPWLFSLYAKIKGKTDLSVTGEVCVSSDMDYRQLVGAFTSKPRSGSVRMTFREGSTTDEIIDALVEKGLGSREGFVEAINNYPFEYDFVEVLSEVAGEERKYRLDGYLYPDTYDFYTERSEAYYIYKLLDRFASVTENIRKNITPREFDEALIMASMIQRSTSRVGQYEYLSAVFHNRLDGYTECPASSVYGVSGAGGVYVGAATEETVNADTPYNTFKNKGLPPGAICNPGLNALVCALRPAKSEYRYFVTAENGECLFAVSKWEHDKNCTSIR